jgi:hypothetical protein
MQPSTFRRLSWYGTATAIAATVTLSSVGFSWSDSPAPADKGLEAALIASRPRQSEVVRSASPWATIVTSQAYGDERVVVARAKNAGGEPRTVFALMKYEDGIGWYPAET